MITRLVLLFISLVLVMAVPLVYATPTTIEEESPAAPESEPEEQPAQTEEEAEPTREETTDSIATSEEEQNQQAADISQDDIEPCLLDPSLPSCPKPDENQDCPEGWAQNEDGNCFPLHPDGCPNGYHGHEDDETGRCIPNSTPCDPSYILVSGENGRKNCERKEFYCQTHEDDNRCNGNNDNDNDNNNNNHKQNHKHVDIKVIKEQNEKDSEELGDIEQTIVAIDYNSGAGINCVIDKDDNGKCETFDVTVDKGKEPLLQIIEFD